MVNLFWKGKSNQFINLKNTIKNYASIFQEIDINSPNEKITGQKTFKKEEWRNKLFWADNLDVLYYLLNDFKEKIDLIYIDPPFFSGTNYRIKVEDKERHFEDHIKSHYTLSNYITLFCRRKNMTE